MLKTVDEVIEACTRVGLLAGGWPDEQEEGSTAGEAAASRLGPRMFSALPAQLTSMAARAVRGGRAAAPQPVSARQD